MTENMKKFLEALSKEKEPYEKASKLDKDALIALARELGIELTEADFAQPEGELNDDELDAVAGGSECICVGGGEGFRSTNAEQYCLCVLGGGGEKDARAGGGCRCACVLAGYGDYIDPV